MLIIASPVEHQATLDDALITGFIATSNRSISIPSSLKDDPDGLLDTLMKAITEYEPFASARLLFARTSLISDADFETRAGVGHAHISWRSLPKPTSTAEEWKFSVTVYSDSFREPHLFVGKLFTTVQLEE